MSGKITLILGGARSGKSAYAQQQAEASAGNVLFIATAQAYDEEMKTRIEDHRKNRPAHWFTLEAPHAVGRAFLAWQDEHPQIEPSILILDCMTLLVSNLLLSLPEPLQDESVNRVIHEELDELLHAIGQSSAEWIIVSNEVGLGLVPPYPLGRFYRDALGRVNQRLAAAAEKVIFLVAGLPMRIK